MSWIAMSEQLPPEGQQVLLTDGEVCAVAARRDYKLVSSDGPGMTLWHADAWSGYEWDWDWTAPTHWMPLPELPKLPELP